jgi:hypothetical protein
MEALNSLLKRAQSHQSFEQTIDNLRPHHVDVNETAIYANHQNYRRT